MKFERLESSIELNREEEPSIFMALCMVESLFRDIRDVSGKDISENPLGDEMLPVRLAWLDRVVYNIYARNRTEFVRGLDRVDKMETMLQAEREELERVASAAEILKAKEAEAKTLAAQLEAAREAQQTWDRLTQECAEKRSELQKLQAVDPARAQAELNSLTAQVETLQKQQQGILENRRHCAAVCRNSPASRLPPQKQRKNCSDSRQHKLPHWNSRKRKTSASPRNCVPRRPNWLVCRQNAHRCRHRPHRHRRRRKPSAPSRSRRSRPLYRPLSRLCRSSRISSGS